ncbi:hypothetical protein C9374_007989 [Naegleria lovaniensis]|uniref:RWP-RK domain-containing protein n=1 Tax=Naegleria lovaniensis TaxID=51637 RepID=A0AA88GKG8_NAELO|nr:uncharacterized protein C9374_007989 [Naegleria lovaniensis]KAG2378841.1 hypothetical protein C9374_007989 [Naegleria lovaniensis]
MKNHSIENNNTTKENQKFSATTINQSQSQHFQILTSSPTCGPYSFENCVAIGHHQPQDKELEITDTLSSAHVHASPSSFSSLSVTIATETPSKLPSQNTSELTSKSSLFETNNASVHHRNTQLEPTLKTSSNFTEAFNRDDEEEKKNKDTEVLPPLSLTRALVVQNHDDEVLLHNKTFSSSNRSTKASSFSQQQANQLSPNPTLLPALSSLHDDVVVPNDDNRYKAPNMCSLNPVTTVPSSNMPFSVPSSCSAQIFINSEMDSAMDTSTVTADSTRSSQEKTKSTPTTNTFMLLDDPNPSFLKSYKATSKTTATTTTLQSASASPSLNNMFTTNSVGSQNSSSSGTHPTTPSSSPRKQFHSTTTSANYMPLNSTTSGAADSSPPLAASCSSSPSLQNQNDWSTTPTPRSLNVMHAIRTVSASQMHHAVDENHSPMNHCSNSTIHSMANTLRTSPPREGSGTTTTVSEFPYQQHHVVARHLDHIEQESILSDHHSTCMITTKQESSTLIPNADNIMNNLRANPNSSKTISSNMSTTTLSHALKQQPMASTMDTGHDYFLSSSSTTKKQFMHSSTSTNDVSTSYMTSTASPASPATTITTTTNTITHPPLLPSSFNDSPRRHGQPYNKTSFQNPTVVSGIGGGGDMTSPSTIADNATVDPTLLQDRFINSKLSKPKSASEEKLYTTTPVPTRSEANIMHVVESSTANETPHQHAHLHAHEETTDQHSHEDETTSERDRLSRRSSIVESIAAEDEGVEHATTPVKKPPHKKKGPKKREISRQDMEKYFHVSQTVAAKLLGVSVSTLKRRFYEEFNMKWPYVPTKQLTSTSTSSSLAKRKHSKSSASSSATTTGGADHHSEDASTPISAEDQDSPKRKKLVTSSDMQFSSSTAFRKPSIGSAQTDSASSSGESNPMKVRQRIDPSHTFMDSTQHAMHQSLNVPSHHQQQQQRIVLDQERSDLSYPRYEIHHHPQQHRQQHTHHYYHPQHYHPHEHLEPHQQQHAYYQDGEVSKGSSSSFIQRPYPHSSHYVDKRIASSRLHSQQRQYEISSPSSHHFQHTPVHSIQHSSQSSLNQTTQHYAPFQTSVMNQPRKSLSDTFLHFNPPIIPLNRRASELLNNELIGASSSSNTTPSTSRNMSETEDIAAHQITLPPISSLRHHQDRL